MPSPSNDHLTAGLFPPGVFAASSTDRGAEDGLLPAERAFVERAIEARRAEFAAGRALARALLGRLGVQARPILVGPDRAPVWPEGVVGSIAHTKGLCVAAVARRAEFRGLGIDVEPGAALEPVLWESVCTADEARWLNGRPEGERGRLARVLFCAKEAYFKCQHPLTGAWLEFTDVAVLLDPQLEAFKATVVDGRTGSIPAEGRVGVRGGWIVAAAWIGPPG